jgi:hypothetical protein
MPGISCRASEPYLLSYKSACRRSRVHPRHADCWGIAELQETEERLTPQTEFTFTFTHCVPSVIKVMGTITTAHLSGPLPRLPLDGSPSHSSTHSGSFNPASYTHGSFGNCHFPGSSPSELLGPLEHVLSPPHPPSPPLIRLSSF